MLLRAFCKCFKFHAVATTGNRFSSVTKKLFLTLSYHLSSPHSHPHNHHSCFASSSTDDSARREKTVYSREEITDIVRHMQTLSLLWPSDDKKAEVEEMQVQCLVSTMKIAEQLREVDTDGVEPLHNPSEAFPAYLREDEPLGEEDSRGRDEMMGNSRMTRDGYFFAPPIPASKASR